ncbi:MAG: hypothetical protein ACW990_04595 [Promethearchaeota archaeon]|jgi:flagellar motor protein MotB
MAEDQQEKREEQLSEEEKSEVDDLKLYLEEMKALESDFSDLEDLDVEELQEIQDAIAKVKEGEELYEPDQIREISLQEQVKTELEIESAMKESMVSDFSDMDEIDFDELKEMQDAIESVKQEQSEELQEGEIRSQSNNQISVELEERIKKELLKRKEEEEEVITPDKFLDYIKNKRDKIWYHSLYYIVFNIEDHIASKMLLYDVLKEVTSKSPIDPIPEHQFYFGLGYILRLSLNGKQVVRFLRDGKFKINVNVSNLKELLEIAGPPISTRPVISKEEKDKMFKNFLDEDFMDI